MGIFSGIFWSRGKPNVNADQHRLLQCESFVSGDYTFHLSVHIWYKKRATVSDNSLFSLFIFIAALAKPVQELNVYALRTFMFLTVRRHHEFKEICLCLFVVSPDLTPVVAYGSDFLCSRHCQFWDFQHSCDLHKFYCRYIIYHSKPGVQLCGKSVIFLWNAQQYRHFPRCIITWVIVPLTCGILSITVIRLEKLFSE